MKRVLNKFRRDENGTITIEFVIIAPLLFTVILAGFEFFDAFKSYGRAAKVTYTIADNLSRRQSIDEAKITELHGLMNALIPWMKDGKTLTVTSISYNADDGYVCEWSKHSDANLTLNFDVALNSLALGSKAYTDILPDIAEGDSVILVETQIPHRTIVRMFGLGDLVWTNQVAIRPRFTSKLLDTTDNPTPCT